MYNELVKKISEASPFKPMEGEELGRVEAEEKAREEIERKKREEEDKIRIEKAKATELKCPHCSKDLKEEGMSEARDERNHQSLYWTDMGWEWGDSDYGDSDHISWNCGACGRDIQTKDFDPNEDFMPW